MALLALLVHLHARVGQIPADHNLQSWAPQVVGIGIEKTIDIETTVTVTTTIVTCYTVTVIRY